MAHILVIDDDESLLQMMSLMLKRAGHQTTLASDGYEGIDVARREKPDMAIVDVMMPDISGFEVCRMMREDPRTKDIPLLILTALTQADHRTEAHESGADDYVTKPVTRDDLISHVEQLLEAGAHNIPTPRQDAVIEPPPTPVEDTPPAPSIPDLFVSPPPAAPSPPQQTYQQPPAARPPQQTYQQPPAATPAQQSPRQPAVSRPTGGVHLVAVLGLNNGVGATTLANNLSLALMQHGRACVFDAHSQNGQVAMQLKMVPPRNTWQNLVSIQQGDKRAIGGSLLFDHPSGVGVIAAPFNSGAAEIPPNTLSYVYQVLAEGFKRIVVDVPSNFSSMAITTLRQAKSIVVVVGENPAYLSAAPQIMNQLQAIGVTGQIYAVINRTSPQGVTNMDVMQALNQPVAADLPYEPDMSSAMMEGLPLVMYKPDSLFSKTVVYLARQL